MNEFVIRLLKGLIVRLEQSSLEKHLEGDTSVTTGEIPELPKNSLSSRIFFAIFITGLYFFALFAGYMFYDEEIPGFHFIYILSLGAYLLIESFIYIVFLGHIRKNDCKLGMFAYLIYYPIYFIPYLVLYTVLLKSHVSFSDYSYVNIWTHGYLAILCVGIYPILYIIQSHFSRLQAQWFTYLRGIFLSYNIGFFFLLSLNIILISIGFPLSYFSPISDFIIYILEGIQGESFGFFSGIFVLSLAFFLLTFGVFSLKYYFRESGKSRRVFHIGLLLVLFVSSLRLIPFIVDNFYDSQINKAISILRSGGQNAESYNDARVFMLDRAILSRITSGQYVDRDFFSKVYDSTPEAYYGEKIANYTNNRNSFATNVSQVGEKANVKLTLAEIANVIGQGSKFPVLETTYTFNLANSTDMSQEVIVNFETPSKYSVVSGLRLGLDLQLIGQVAPRGAARQVYENSLRRNIDPALIEKVGLNTYTLRVFPVPSKQDSKTQGRQIVEVKILTPLLSQTEKITYSPRFSFINLKFDADSSIKSKVYDGTKLIKEDIVKNTDIESYLNSEHLLEYAVVKDFAPSDFCIVGDLENLPYLEAFSATNETQELAKISLFFDNSLSIKRSGANKFYDALYSKIKNYGNVLHDVDVFSANFDVVKGVDAAVIKFWGYSDSDRIIEYIINNNIRNQRIVIVTDDDDFNYSTVENMTRDYSSLVSNQISIIKIGKKVKRYKQEMNNILASTNGNIYELNSKEDIDSILSKIFDPQIIDNSVSICSDSVMDSGFNKIQAGYISNQLLRSIKEQSDWESIAMIQTTLSEEYGIVNQFNSLIALENDSQQYELEKYKESDSRYTTSYNNNTPGAPVPNIRRFDNDIDFNSTGFRGGISPSMSGIEDGLIGSSSDYYGYRNRGFEGRVEISFFGLLMFMIYLIQGYSFLGFIIDYVRSYRTK